MQEVNWYMVIAGIRQRRRRGNLLMWNLMINNTCFEYGVSKKKIATPFSKTRNDGTLLVIRTNSQELTLVHSHYKDPPKAETMQSHK